MKKRFGLLLIVFSLLLAACGAKSGALAVSQNGIEVYDPVVRAPGGMMAHGEGGAVAGAFMLIKNTGAQNDRLVKAASDVAELVQVHETTMDGGVMKMAEVAGIDIPAGGQAELKPGGYHVMLINLKQELKPGDSVSITLTFEQAGEITVQAGVIKQ
ncbi:MAG: copper chaperone PCu(A)C [Chloroflexi bacterium]|nr:MAG: copper chaperone PCu(A)C [Chloroflexota bacterium]